MATRRFPFLTLLASLILILVLAACGGTSTQPLTGATPAGGGGGGGADSPEAAVRGFLEAVYTGEGDAAAMMCESNADVAEQTRAGMAAITAAFAANNASVDASGLTYETISEEGDTAQVTVGGNLEVTVAGTAQTIPFTETTITVRNEDGWKICG